MTIDWYARVREIERVNRWTHRQVAEAVGVSPRTVEGWLGPRRFRPDRRARRVLKELWMAVMQGRGEGARDETRREVEAHDS